jgi:hypothetical protein
LRGRYLPVIRARSSIPHCLEFRMRSIVDRSVRC